MFATGSHDGAVRIWTAPETDSPYISRATANPAGTPRNPSPNTLDVGYRTDSPESQFTESRDGNYEDTIQESSISGPSGVSNDLLSAPSNNLLTVPSTSSDAERGQSRAPSIIRTVAFSTQTIPPPS